MTNKRPSFQWYPKDYLTDENTIVMTLEEEGAYRRLMDYCWLHGSLPDSMERMAPMCKTDSTRMAVLWVAIEPCFQKQGARWVHPRLELEIRKQDSHREAKVAAGKKGAKARWEKEENGSAIVSPMAKNASSSASSSASATPVSKEEPIQGGNGATKIAIPLPESWSPNDSHKGLAARLQLDIDHQHELFRGHAEMHGRTLKNWNAGFTNWLKKAQEFAPNNPNQKQIPMERAGQW